MAQKSMPTKHTRPQTEEAEHSRAGRAAETGHDQRVHKLPRPLEAWVDRGALALICLAAATAAALLLLQAGDLASRGDLVGAAASVGAAVVTLAACAGIALGWYAP